MAQNVISITAPPMTRQRRLATFGQGMFFVAGFATFIIGIFGALGALSDLVFDMRGTIRVIGGVLLIVFGLSTMHIINIPILGTDTRKLTMNPRAGVSGARSYMMGLSFAAGWSPCIGPFLGAILSLSVAAGTMWIRLGLLVAYVFGLGVPFLLLALLAERMTPVLTKLKRHMRVIEIVGGVLLIAIGIVMIGGQLAQMSAFFARSGLTLEGTGSAPSIFVAGFAGLLSFASPCVLPLMPAYLCYLGGVAVNASYECE